MTRDPKWRDTIKLKFKAGELVDLINYRVMFRIVSHASRGATMCQTMGRGVLAFDQIAKHRSTTFTFSVDLEYNGLPAGTLSGDAKVKEKMRKSRRRAHRSSGVLEY
ncbi:unnamed protein product [Ostreobium quekettii]|uniref:C2 domain-containing protein n=1 Tax=Ostreobium quekettii TaxID=121088 RepID=A0A8S1J4V6_9CHLO|nr:unnamed protein product [Ostreobium quekettii]